MNKFLCFLCFCLLFAPQAMARDIGSCEEAKALALRSAEFLQKNGLEEANVAFLDKGGPFNYKDLYVFILNHEATVLFHGGRPNVKGSAVQRLIDINGKSFVDAILAVKDVGWVNYKYMDPSDRDRIKDKYTYIVRRGNFVIGVGCYEQVPAELDKKVSFSKKP